MAARAINVGQADLVSFGRAYLFNPDLPRRLREGAPLNDEFEDALIYGGAHGYTDYATLDEVQAAGC